MEKELEFIQDRIIVINEIPVMIDSDLAKFYGVETKRINEAVRNNSNKFPERYSWKLSVDESNEILRSKISTSKLKDEYSRSKSSTLYI